MPSDAFKSWWKKFGETEDICPVRLDYTRENIRALFGEPDEMGGTSRKHKTPAIWKYGELEFHFKQGPTIDNSWFDCRLSTLLISCLVNARSDGDAEQTGVSASRSTHGRVFPCRS
jgi:hypothetical protein